MRVPYLQLSPLLIYCLSMLLGCGKIKSSFPYQTIQAPTQSEYYTFTHLEWSKDKTKILLLSASSQNWVYIFDRDKKILLSSLPEQVKTAHFSPDGNLLVTTGPLGIKIWEAGTGRLTATLSTSETYDSAIFLDDGNKVASIKTNSMKPRELALWENSNEGWQSLPSHSLTKANVNGHTYIDSIELALKGNKFIISQMTNDRDSSANHGILQRLEILDLEGNILFLYDLTTTTIEQATKDRNFRKLLTRFYPGMVSSDGKYFALNLAQDKWTEDKLLDHNLILQVWNTETQQVIYEELYADEKLCPVCEEGFPHEIKDLTFSEDGHRLIVLHQSSPLLEGIQLPEGRKVFSVDYTNYTKPDGELVWNDGKLIKFSHSPFINATISCGRFLLTTAKNSVRPALWDIQTGDFVSRLDFSEEGSSFAYTGSAVCSSNGQDALIGVLFDNNAYKMFTWDLSL